MSEEKPKRVDARCGVEFLAGVILIVVSIYVMCKSITFWKEDYVQEFYYSSGLMPMIIGIALLIFSVIYTVRTLKEHSFKECLVDLKNFWAEQFKNKIFWKSIITLVIMGIYIYVLLGKAPFWLGTFVTLTALLLFINWEKPMKAKSIIKFCVISAVATALIIVVFSLIFKVPLP